MWWKFSLSMKKLEAMMGYMKISTAVQAKNSLSASQAATDAGHAARRHEFWSSDFFFLTKLLSFNVEPKFCNSDCFVATT
jgi:hypothetical protein